MMLLSMIAALAIASEPPNRPADVAALIKAKESEWNGYYRRQDADGLAKFLADGFVHFQENGSIETKESAVAWVRDNQWDPEGTFRYKVTDIKFYGPDTANVYGVGSYQTEDCRKQYVSSNIFIRKQDGWHPIFSHSSDGRCPEEESN